MDVILKRLESPRPYWRVLFSLPFLSFIAFLPPSCSPLACCFSPIADVDIHLSAVARQRVRCAHDLSRPKSFSRSFPVFVSGFLRPRRLWGEISRQNDRLKVREITKQAKSDFQPIFHINTWGEMFNRCTRTHREKNSELCDSFLSFSTSDRPNVQPKGPTTTITAAATGKNPPKKEMYVYRIIINIVEQNESSERESDFVVNFIIQFFLLVSSSSTLAPHSVAPYRSPIERKLRISLHS